MRRHDKECTDPAVIAQVLDEAEWGVLALVSATGSPLMVPLNFARVEDRLVFHSAAAGEKMEALQAGGAATFLVVDALAPIPSYAFGPERACAATQFYRSVLLYGRVDLVTDPDRKAEALAALMAKLQPEGGYAPITAMDPLYRASVENVAILAMTVDRTSAKASLGRNLDAEKRAAVQDLLGQRGRPVDLRTLEAMEQAGG